MTPNREENREMKKKKLKKSQDLENWTRVGFNLYFFKDEDGTVWQLLRTPYKEIPACTIK